MTNSAFPAPAPAPAQAPRARLHGIWVYLAILATVFAVASVVLGVKGYQAMDRNTAQVVKLEQLQRATNYNLCQQEAYGAGAVCEGD